MLNFHTNQNWLKAFTISSLLVLGTSCSNDEVIEGDLIQSAAKASASVKLSYNSITASTEQTENSIGNIDDNDPSLETRWSAFGTSVNVDVDFGKESIVDYVNIAFKDGDERKSFFSYWQSTDGISWERISSKTSSGATEMHEEFDLANSNSRYFRIEFQGNSVNEWNSVSDLEFFGAAEVIPDNDDNGGNTEGEPDVDFNGLDPNKTPAENFDLSQWKLTPSSGKDVSVSDLNNNFEISDQFYTGADGGMVFKNFPEGAGTTTNSTYSRVEFREMLDTNANDTSISKNNWVFSSSSSSNESKSGGVGGTLTATLAVNRVTTTSKSNAQLGRIVIGQIHASDNEPIRLYYKKMPNDSKGAIYFVHEDSKGVEAAVNIIGDFAVEAKGDSAGDYTGASQPSNGIPLDEVFSYKIEVIGTMLYAHIYRDGYATLTGEYDMSNSGYADDWMYFKAGLYSQNKTVQSSSDYEQVTFYALENTH